MPEPPIFALQGSPKNSRARSFLLSFGIHAVAVALVATAGHGRRLVVEPNPYRERIAGQEHKIIWYGRIADLPPVTPAESASPRPGRPRVFDPRQSIAARSVKAESRRQMILQLPPELRLERDLRAPNLLVWTPAIPRPPRAPFAPPRAVRSEERLLPEAPQIAAAANAPPARIDVAAPPKPERAKFQVPARDAPVPAGPLADAPAITTAANAVPARIDVAAPPRPERAKFQVPARAAPAPAGPLADGAPQIAAAATASPARIDVAAPERPRFSVPARGGVATARPALAVEQPSAVIVGLDPAPANIQTPLPPGNRAAEFSAGPNGGGLDGNGAASPVEAAIRVPGLSVSPAAAAALTAPNIPRAPIPETDRAAFRRRLLSSARADGERFLQGSTVYTLAIDMPNISSQEGSWILRFTETGGSSVEDRISPPVPMIKVDPKYIASAAAEGVEGKVLLYAVIRRDGQVDRIRLVQGIDERLDTSAVEAFAKWQFQPATRNGEPVDLEATVQIPFRLGRRR